MFGKLIAYNINILGKKIKEMLQHSSILFEGVVCEFCCATASLHKAKKDVGKKKKLVLQYPLSDFSLTFPSAQLPHPLESGHITEYNPIKLLFKFNDSTSLFKHGLLMLKWIGDTHHIPWMPGERAAVRQPVALRCPCLRFLLHLMTSFPTSRSLY